MCEALYRFRRHPILPRTHCFETTPRQDFGKHLLLSFLLFLRARNLPINRDLQSQTLVSAVNMYVQIPNIDIRKARAP